MNLGNWSLSATLIDRNPPDLIWWPRFILRNVFKAIFTSVRRQWYVSTWGNNLDWCQNQKRKNGRRIKLTPPFTTLWQKVCHVLTETKCLVYSEFVPSQATARTELCLYKLKWQIFYPYELFLFYVTVWFTLLAEDCLSTFVGVDGCCIKCKNL